MSSLSLRSNYGPRNTYTGFGPNDSPNVIDVVLVLDNGLVHAPSQPPKEGQPVWKVDRTGVIPNAVDDGRGGFMSSDHQLTVAGLRWVG